MEKTIPIKTIPGFEGGRVAIKENYGECELKYDIFNIL
jgi:hypothetical protein